MRGTSKTDYIWVSVSPAKTRFERDNVRLLFVRIVQSVFRCSRLAKEPTLGPFIHVHSKKLITWDILGHPVFNASDISFRRTLDA